MHYQVPTKYYFINSLDTNLIHKQDQSTAIIYRNYNDDIVQRELILKIKKICKKRSIKFFLANNVKLAINLDLDGAYIPSFNKNFSHLNYSFKKNFLLIGSAHNLKEIRVKELQKVRAIFISSLFKRNKNYLGVNRFKLISNLTKKRVVALGGISKKNLKIIKLLSINYFGGISFFE